MEENIIKLDEQACVPTKKEITAAAEKFVERVDEGYMNPLLAYGQITAMEQMLKEAKEKVRELALNEAERYGEKTFSTYGMDIQIKEAGVKYDYSANEYWNQLKETADVANAELKSHEDLLRRLGQCAKSSTTTLSITLRK